MVGDADLTSPNVYYCPRSDQPLLESCRIRYDLEDRTRLESRFNRAVATPRFARIRQVVRVEGRKRRHPKYFASRRLCNQYGSTPGVAFLYGACQCPLCDGLDDGVDCHG